MKVEDRTDNYGNTYLESFIYGNNHKYETLLNMKYSRFKGTLFVPQGITYSNSFAVQIEVDGKIVYTSPAITMASPPIPIDINITGGNDFKIIWSGSRGLVQLGDAGFYQ